MGPNARVRPGLAAALLLASLCGPAAAQDFAAVRGKDPIPREPYKSWSIFLVTNQDWLAAENADRVRDLYWRAQAFGRVIGRDHLAVWFWKKDLALGSPALADNVDVERAIAYCQQLGLRPSAGPYLLFTTTYPDENAGPSMFGAVELGTSSTEIGRLLNLLGDQIVTDGLIKNGMFVKPVGSDDFWIAWFNATLHGLTSFGSSFRSIVRTPTLTMASGKQGG
jgi:hypothetical protein